MPISGPLVSTSGPSTTGPLTTPLLDEDVDVELPLEAEPDVAQPVSPVVVTSDQHLNSNTTNALGRELNHTTCRAAALVPIPV